MTVSSPPPRISQDPHEPAFVQNPYAFYARLHAFGGVAFWEEYGWVAFAKYTDINAILRDRRFGRVDPLAAPPPEHLSAFYDIEAHSMLEQDGAAHARLRKHVNRAFTSRAIETLAPVLAARAHRLIDAFAGAGEAELISAFCEPLAAETIATLLGVDPARVDDLLAWSHAMVAMYRPARSEAVEQAACEAASAFRAFIEAEIAVRRADPGDDLLSRLVSPDDDDPLSDDEIVSTAILLLNAGHEATAQGVGLAIRTLATAEDRAACLAADRIDATVEETLRHAPPLHIFVRYAQEPVVMRGVAFERGDAVGLILGAAGRDPGKHEEPDLFDPTRPEPSHVAFSAGAHFCVGAPLARLELRTAIPILFERLPNLRPAAGPVLADRYHFHGFDRLDVSF